MDIRDIECARLAITHLAKMKDGWSVKVPSHDEPLFLRNNTFVLTEHGINPVNTISTGTRLCMYNLNEADVSRLLLSAKICDKIAG